MKKVLFLCALALTSMAHAQKPVKVQGTIDDPTVTELYLQMGEEGNFGQFRQTEVIPVKKGKFTLTKPVNEIVPAHLMRDTTSRKNRMWLVLVPGEKMKLTVEKDGSYTYDGSKIYQEMGRADKAISAVSKAFQDYYKEANEQLANAPEDQKQQLVETLNQELMKRYNAQKEATQKYQDEHLGEEGAVLFLSDGTDVEMLYSKLLEKDTEYGKSRVGKYLQGRIKYIVHLRELQQERERQEQAKMDAMKGAPALDFTLNDINGKSLTLSSLRGKYVILDFWGSWCGWCIKGIPDMKKAYAKYSDKMEILGIDCNDTEQAWKKAVEKHELPWLHVYNPNGSTLVSDYNVQGFPTKIVVDPEGNVAKIIVGEDPAFYTYLDELLGQ